MSSESGESNPFLNTNPIEYEPLKNIMTRIERFLCYDLPTSSAALRYPLRLDWCETEVKVGHPCYYASQRLSGDESDGFYRGDPVGRTPLDLSELAFHMKIPMLHNLAVSYIMRKEYLLLYLQYDAVVEHPVNAL